MKRLEQRAALLKKLRQFFDDRGFVEVETPLVATEVIPEQHIELFSVAPPSTPSHSRDPTDRRSPTAWLQASPEAPMKRLLTRGMEAIYQVTRSFRAEEQGALHRAEFTIVEWYRVGDDMQRGIALLDELCQQLLGTAPARRTSYANAFDRHIGICPHASSADQLAQRCAELGIDIPTGQPSDDRDQWLDLLLTTKIEPHLGTDSPEILFDYPASQAALAKIRTDENGTQVAERFEIYWQGIELANGYHELTDADELRERFVAVNAAREENGRQSLPLPERLLDAIAAGIPDCAGVALGFDRLIMLACGENRIDDVIAFPGE